MFKKIINNFKEESKKMMFIDHFKDTMISFHQNTEQYLWYSSNLSYPYEKHKNGRPLEVYEELVVEVMKYTEKIKAITEENSLSFIANTLYSEIILMDKVNKAVENHVPFDHEVIKDSIYEILEGQKKAFEHLCNINTKSLKEEVIITKTLRIRQDEARNELLKSIKK